MDRKKLIEKITKLLALSENNTETAEAESAKNMAAALMAKHDISIMEAESKPEFKTTYRALTRLKPNKYDSTLISILSNFNEVGYILQPGYGKFKGKNIFVGRESDIQINDYMVEIIFQQRTASWKEYLATHPKPDKSEKKKFMFGYALGVKSKLDSLIKMKDEKIQEYGLVPVKGNKAALDFYKEQNKVRTSKSRPTAIGREGYEAGKNASINKGVQKQTSIKRLA